MNHQYNRLGLTARLRPLALVALLATGAVGTAHAQLSYSVASATNTAGTYTDLGTSGSAIATANTDDANSAATPIGFTFTYNGTAFTDFVLNTNGFLKLGTVAPTGAQYTDGGQSTINGPVDGAETNLLLPFNQDLFAGSAGGTEYRVVNTGTAPNRTCIIQWKNVSDKARPAGGASVATGSQYANFSFQVKLYETSNQIDFVYDAATAGPAATEIPKFISVGIKGSAASASVLATKVSVTPWAGAMFITGPYTGNANNVRLSVLPDAGRTYRFSIQVPNDAAPSAIQGYASVIVPTSNPLSIRGIVRNAGNTALAASTVTLNISGANTYSQTQNVAALAVGATGLVTFPGITLTNVGQNTVTLTVPNDGNNSNNSYSQPMETSATTISLATPGASSGNNVFAAGDDRYYASKITLNAPCSIIAVSGLIGDAGNQATAKTSVGESVYGVVIDATNGNLLARSANYVITQADVNAFHTFTLSVPATVLAGDVLVGIAQTASTGTLAYYPFGVQVEDPNRLNTYYIGSTTGGTPTATLTTATTTNYKFPFGAVTAAPATNDLAMNEIQGYGSIAVPAGNPFSLRAVVRNAGVAALTTPKVVTLTISGANSFTQNQTLTALAVGGTAVLTFTNISVPNVGANTVTVTLPNDDNNGNNSVAQAMATSATRFSFETPGAASGNSVLTAGTNNYYAAKITLNATRSITSVSALISSAGASSTSKSSVGESVYGVVVNATTGVVLGRSANYVIATADIDTQHTFTFSAPVTVPAGDVLIGMAQTASTSATLPYYPFGVQNESPNRPNTFYTGSATTAAAPTAALTAAGVAIYKLPFGAETTTPPTCMVPTAFTLVSNMATSATFSFTAVAGATGYQILYGPQGFTPGGSSSLTSATFTASPFTLSGLSSSTAYDFYIRTICSATDQSSPAGPLSLVTPCVAPTISTFPYTQNFDAVAPSQPLPCGISVIDANNDGFTWQARGMVDPSLSNTNVSRSTPNAMVYVYNSNDATVGANDWFFTPPLALTSTQRYRVSFYYRTASGYPEGLEVKYGTAATPAGQTATLFSNTTIANAAYSLVNNVSTPAVLDLTSVAGTYFVGFHVISSGNQGFLAVDDLMITAGPLATSEALKRAVSVFPNPSTSGVFNLEIHGANAKQALGVEVHNMLGQQVYTGTAKDNFRTNVDLSTLAAGIYIIKVRNGAEYTMQQISIVK